MACQENMEEQNLELEQKKSRSKAGFSILLVINHRSRRNEHSQVEHPIRRTC